MKNLSALQFVVLILAVVANINIIRCRSIKQPTKLPAAATKPTRSKMIMVVAAYRSHENSPRQRRNANGTDEHRDPVTFVKKLDELPLIADKQQRQLSVQIRQLAPRISVLLSSEQQQQLLTISSSRKQQRQLFGGKLPPFIERIIQRIQNYFSVYNPPQYLQQNRPPTIISQDILPLSSCSENAASSSSTTCHPVIVMENTSNLTDFEEAFNNGCDQQQTTDEEDHSSDCENDQNCNDNNNNDNSSSSTIDGNEEDVAINNVQTGNITLEYYPEEEDLTTIRPSLLATDQIDDDISNNNDIISNNNIVVSQTIVQDSLVNIYSTAGQDLTADSLSDKIIIILEPNPPSSPNNCDLSIDKNCPFDIINKPVINKFHVFTHNAFVNNQATNISKPIDDGNKIYKEPDENDNVHYSVVINHNHVEEYTDNLFDNNNNEENRISSTTSPCRHRMNCLSDDEVKSADGKTAKIPDNTTAPTINLILIPLDTFEKTNRTSCFRHKPPMQAEQPSSNVEYYILKPDSGTVVPSSKKNRTKNSSQQNPTDVKQVPSSLLYLPPSSSSAEEATPIIGATVTTEDYDRVTAAQVVTTIKYPVLSKFPLLYKIFNKIRDQPPRT